MSKDLPQVKNPLDASEGSNSITLNSDLGGLFMGMQDEDLRELERNIADRIYIRVEKWNLYLGDAGLSDILAIECKAHLDKGPSVAAKKALEAVQVKLGGGNIQLPLIQLISSGQVFDLEEILGTYCR